jgi:hypothetical protein
VAGADTGAVVAVEVFMKGNEIAPVGVGVKLFRGAEDRSAALFVAQKYTREPLGEIAGDLPEIEPPA